eukprot:CAMPEP_0180811054 /NCGR_PEP_ID=MMETSP1038_2-20121128/65236_1 /TAXON_ID=632150 /ORGANISM="Azadinium spinosum, Strain 3D9" /LENGTH=120 /DNA_ID=CAMNT_0022852431 /DNA_START=365 /DNA_END=724 /DNA_ORIENTATION=+
MRDVHAIFGSIFQLPKMVAAVVSSVTVMIEVGASVAGQTVIVFQKSPSLMYWVLALECGSRVLRFCLTHVFTRIHEWFEHQSVAVELEWVEPLVPENAPTVRSSTAERRTMKGWDRFWQH